MKNYSSCKFFLIIVSVIIFLGQNSFSQWHLVNMDLQVNRFLAKGGILYAAAKNLYYSTDNGNTWITEDTSYSNGISLLTLCGYNFFAVSSSSGKLIKSTDKGKSWADANNALPNLSIEALAAKGNYLFAGTSRGWPNSGIFVSTDNGVHWNYSSNGLYSNSFIGDIFCSDDVIFITSFAEQGLLVGGIYTSTDNGANWKQSNSGLFNIFCTKFGMLPATSTNYPYVFVGNKPSPNGHMPNGAYVSSDNGTSWKAVNKGIENTSIQHFSSNASILFASSYNAVYFTTDYGSIWNSVDLTGLPQSSINAIYVFENYLYAAISDKGIWRRPLMEITDVKGNSAKLPPEYSLEQNYPNPFNPTTNISYSIPEGRNVKLTVFDILGKEVATLVNEYKEAGTYTVQYNASSMPSGTYIYAILAGEFRDIKKLMHLK